MKKRLSRIERNEMRCSTNNNGINDVKIISAVKTDKGTKKLVSDIAIIPGKFEDYKLEKMLELGVKLNPVFLTTNSEIATTKILQKVETIENNLNNSENE